MALSPSLSVRVYASTDIDILKSSQETVGDILARMGDAGLTPAEVVALLASYAISRSYLTRSLLSC
jgi:hypothetical protein